MGKKIGLLLGVAASLALVVPALASATTGFTQPVGTLIPTGTIITFTNTAPFSVTSSRTGNINCATGKVMAEAKLTTNSLSQVTMMTGGNLFTASCTTASGGAATISNFQISSFQTTGGGTGAISYSFQIELASVVTCKYTGTGTATYNPSETSGGGNTITLTEQPLSVTPVACGTMAKDDAVFGFAYQATTIPVYLM